MMNGNTRLQTELMTFENTLAISRIESKEFIRAFEEISTQTISVE